jgi:hypothetical protein
MTSLNTTQAGAGRGGKERENGERWLGKRKQETKEGKTTREKGRDELEIRKKEEKR